MCRWFAYISQTEPCLLEDVLVTPDNALANQIHDHYLPGLLPHNPRDINDTPDKLISIRNVLFNLDGFGVTWYTSTRASYVDGVAGLRPAMYKSITPPLTDFNFKIMAANIETTALFGHIRAGGIAPVAVPSNHPFVFGRHTFMHNGTVMKFRETARVLSDLMSVEAYKHIQGTTDSEAIAALYMTYLAGDDQSAAAWEKEYSVQRMKTALRLAVLAVISTQRRILGQDFEASSLNLAATDGRRLVACRFRNHATEAPPSLYYSTTAGVSLNRKFEGGRPDQAGPLEARKHGKHIIVSSEPSTYQENQWTLIDRNSILTVDVDHEVMIENMPYDMQFNGKE